MTKGLLFFQYTVALAVELEIASETLLCNGLQAGGVDIFVPGDEGLLRADQRGEKTAVITFSNVSPFPNG